LPWKTYLQKGLGKEPRKSCGCILDPPLKDDPRESNGFSHKFGTLSSGRVALLRERGPPVLTQE